MPRDCIISLLNENKSAITFRFPKTNFPGSLKHFKHVPIYHYIIYHCLTMVWDKTFEHMFYSCGLRVIQFLKTNNLSRFITDYRNKISPTLVKLQSSFPPWIKCITLTENQRRHRQTRPVDLSFLTCLLVFLTEYILTSPTLAEYLQFDFIDLFWQSWCSKNVLVGHKRLI